MTIVRLFFLLTLSFCCSNANALNLEECRKLFTSSHSEDSKQEHLFGGPLDETTLYPRRGYVMSYNTEYNVPSWVAWRAIKSYRDTPERVSRWSSFRRDPDLPQVTTQDYVGWFDSKENYARGHLVPYYISGGDRDHDGKDAEFETTLKVEDKDDACTVLEINSMTNVAPQFHKKFNGRPGVWWRLETDIREMLDSGRKFQIFAGTIFVPDAEVTKIGRFDSEGSWDKKIGVPHGFFKVVIDLERLESVAFLFDHSKDLDKGCNIPNDENTVFPFECIVEIKDIEIASGLRFFKFLNKLDIERLSQSSNLETWKYWTSH